MKRRRAPASPRMVTTVARRTSRIPEFSPRGVTIRMLPRYLAAIPETPMIAMKIGAIARAVALETQPRSAMVPRPSMRRKFPTNTQIASRRPSTILRVKSSIAVVSELAC